MSRIRCVPVRVISIYHSAHSTELQIDVTRKGGKKYCAHSALNIHKSMILFWY